jgi:hypothetical protein
VSLSAANMGSPVQAGYFVTAPPTAASATDTFKVPILTCDTTLSGIALGSFIFTIGSSFSLASVFATCQEGAAVYYGVLAVNGAITFTTFSPTAGDRVDATVSESATATKVTLKDVGQSKSETVTGIGATNELVEVGIDSLVNSINAQLPVPELSTVKFTAAGVDGTTPKAATVLGVDMKTSTGVLQIKTGALNATGNAWSEAGRPVDRLTSPSVTSASPVPASAASGLRPAPHWFLDSNAFIKCPLVTTTPYQVDPILDRTGNSMHNHIFFGNTTMAANVAQVTGPGNYQTLLSDANNEPPQSGSTTCSDKSDGTGYWFPEMFYHGVERTEALAGPRQGDPVFVKDYYVTEGSETATATYIPDVLQMVAGNPSATAPPTITNRHQAATYIQSVFWNCGRANGGDSIMSPRSPWPYSCAKWRANMAAAGMPISVDDGLDGLVARITFPACVDPTKDSPNGDNLDHGPFFASPGISTTKNDLAYNSPTDGSCPYPFTQQIAQISVLLETYLEDGGGTAEPVFASGSNASQLPSCYSEYLNPPGPQYCTNTAPAASDLAFGFVSDTNPTGAGCPTAGGTDGCSYYTVHGDYMQMWQQVNPAILNTGPEGTDPAGSKGTLEDIQKDCLFGTAARQCGIVPGNNFSAIP